MNIVVILAQDLPIHKAVITKEGCLLFHTAREVIDSSTCVVLAVRKAVNNVWSVPNRETSAHSGNTRKARDCAIGVCPQCRLCQKPFGEVKDDTINLG